MDESYRDGPAEGQSWWQWFKSLPKRTYRMFWRSGQSGTMKRDTYVPAVAVCKVFSKKLGTAKQITEVRLVTVADKKRSPEAKVTSTARHAVKKKLGCRWSAGDLMFKTEVKNQ